MGVCSAAATLSGITHSISSCVILMEMTAQSNNVLPLLITAAVAYSVAGLFTISIYDMFMELGASVLKLFVCICILTYFVVSAIDCFHSRHPLLAIRSKRKAISTESQRCDAQYVWLPDHAVHAGRCAAVVETQAYRI